MLSLRASLAQIWCATLELPACKMHAELVASRRSLLAISTVSCISRISGVAAAAAIRTLADGSLADENGQLFFLAPRRRLLDSYAKRHALGLSLGIVLSFMAVKLAVCGFCLGRRYLRDRKRKILDDHVYTLGPSEWEIDMTDIKVVKRKDGEDWELGAGNFGRVLRGIRGDVQPVAIKTTFKRNKQMEDAFIREIAMMKYVSRDRNIVQFYGACVQTQCLLLVSELMEGGDLRRALNRENSDEWSWYRRGKSVCVDMARGLAFLHANKVIHRDVKSNNILLTRDGVAKIGDVGMAKITMDGYLTRDGALGTMAWAAPELLLGEKCSEKVDIYSLGVCLWEVVTQEVPMRGNLRDPVVPRECPQEIADLMTACRQRDQSKRPTAKEVCRLLYQAAPAWEKPEEVRAMLEDSAENSLASKEVTAEMLTLDSADELTEALVDIKEKPQLAMVVLDIKARLEATRSITPASTLSNPAISPVQRPQPGFFAQEPRDRPPLGSNGTNGSNGTGSYDTATLHNSRRTEDS